MSVNAKLISLEAFEILDPAGRDSISMRVTMDDGGPLRALHGLRRGDKILFADIAGSSEFQDLSFDDQVEVFITSHEEFSGQSHNLGKVFIVADEAHLGERKQQFTGDDAHYELTYEVDGAGV